MSIATVLKDIGDNLPMDKDGYVDRDRLKVHMEILSMLSVGEAYVQSQEVDSPMTFAFIDKSRLIVHNPIQENLPVHFTAI